MEIQHKTYCLLEEYLFRLLLEEDITIWTATQRTNIETHPAGVLVF